MMLLLNPNKLAFKGEYASFVVQQSFVNELQRHFPTAGRHTSGHAQLRLVVSSLD
jgi:hypothetical protein